MPQSDFERQLVRATGEDLRTLRRRGFQLAIPLTVWHDPEPDELESQVFDWDSATAQPLARVA